MVEENGGEGFALRSLPGGDVVVLIRHRSSREVKVVLAD
jgi:hypothetical protein